jgi:outer membrane protein assembly factor BamB
MAIAQTDEPTLRKPLRLWPGVAAAVLLLLVRIMAPLVAPDAAYLGMLGGIAGGLVIVLWWLFFSRAPWSERLGAVALMIAAVAATWRIPGILHKSIATAGMGMMFPMLAIPALGLALVAWAAASRGLSNGPRRAAMVASLLLACGVFTLLRTGGISGEGDLDLHWRWTQTPEEQLLAQADEKPAAVPAGAVPPAAAKAPEERPAAPESDPAAAPVAEAPAAPETPKEQIADGEPAAVPNKAPAAAETEAAWPGFRGPQRDGAVRGVQIATDWATSPPAELWRRPIGPGWSSFAVDGNFFYTQEQRGEEEIVSCYRMSTGEPVWRHRDAARFWEANAGAGPRATPTLSNGRVYTLGATGIVNALDAGSGAVVWSRNAASDTGAKLPIWGFSGSPLVIGDTVIVATAGDLVAYDAATGELRWKGPDGGGGYSSPHLATIGGVPQILLQSGRGVISVSPADGKLLWQHEWKGDGIVQPALTAEGDVLLGAGSGMSDGNGVLRIAVAKGSGGWTTQERWTSIGLKPYFNDFVVHKGHAFGFDGSRLACIDLKDGKRKWKDGHYGHGQIVLLPEQDLLLVLSEKGELALVGANPDQFTELAKRPAIEGKTWNHPVLAGDVLLVRNGEEMVAFRVPLAGQAVAGR